MSRSPPRRRIIYSPPGRRVTVPSPNSEVALSHDMFQFEKDGYEFRLRACLDAGDFDEEFHNWYDALDRIGMGSVTTILKERGLIHESLTSRELYLAAKEKEDFDLLFHVRDAFVNTTEVMLQLYNQTRQTELDWDDDDKEFLYKTCDDIVFQYAITMHLQMPERIRQAFYSDEEVEDESIQT